MKEKKEDRKTERKNIVGTALQQQRHKKEDSELVNCQREGRRKTVS